MLHCACNLLTKLIQAFMNYVQLFGSENTENIFN